MNVALSEPSALSEADWVGRCRAGDLAAWRWLYERHFPRVCRLALRLGTPEREAADVCQEVFLRVWRGLGRFRAEAQFSTWLYRITLNEVARAGRARGVRQALAALVGREPEPPSAPRPDEAAERVQARRELAAVLDRLRPKHRAVFVLYELEELSIEEIAEVLGCGPETAKSRLKRARAEFERLRKQRQVVALAGGKR